MTTIKENSARQRFLSQFDSGFLPHIFEFAEIITSTKADVLMLMARKAACFVDCLEELGLVQHNSFVTTDRLLDMDTSWLKNKSIVVVDEALISGTTLFQTTNKLSESQVKSVDYRILCVNNESYSSDLIELNTPCLKLSDQQTTSLCSEIVEAISLLPLPYGVDFPQFRNLRVLARDLDEITNLLNWETHDVTSSLQREHGILSLTLVPTKPVLEKLNQQLGWKTEQGSHIFKIRLYGQLINSTRKIYLFRVMPVAVFDPFSIKRINEIWSNLISLDKSLQFFTTSTSRIRLLQYVVSARLGKLFIDSINLTTKIQPQLDLRTMGYLFPPATIMCVDNLCQSREKLFKKNVSVKSENLRAIAIRDEPPIEGNLLEVQAALTKPFLDFYNEKEKKARALALKFGKSVLNNKEHKEIMGRLSTGISLPELRSILRRLNQFLDVSKTVSMFIDFAIDRGIIVPILAERDGIIFRAYRHGEDIEFTNNEARLFCLMLKSFISSSQRNSVPHLITEKMFVLLIRIGLHKQILTRWYGTLGEDETVGIRYSLKGAVAQAKSRKIYGHNLEENVTSLLLRSGYLGASNDEGYEVKFIPPAPVKEVAVFESELIGSLFGELLYPKHNEGTKSKLTPKELTLLATCLYPNDLAGALVAEIDFFVNFWWRLNKIISQGLNQVVKLEDLRTAIKDIRDKESYFFEAINSGWWKFESFMLGEPEEIKERITKELESNPVYKAAWNSFWSTIPTTFPPELKSLVLREGSWCIRANILVRLVEIALLRKERQMQNRDQVLKMMLRSEAEIKSFTDSLASYDRNWFRRFNNDVPKLLNNNVENILIYARKQLYSLVGEARVIFDLVDTVVVPFGKPRNFVRYPHAMYIDLSPYSGQRNIWEKVYRIVNEYRARARKESGNTTKLDAIPPGQRGFEKGYWVCASGKMGRVWLMRLAETLLNELSSVAKLKLLLIANLQDDWHLLRSEINTEYRGRHFWKLARTLVENPNFKSIGSAFFYAIQTNKKDKEHLEDELLTTIPNLNSVKEDKMVIEEPFNLNVSLKQFSYSEKKKEANMRKADIGFITIVIEETRAVRSFLEKQPEFKRIQGKKSEAIFYEGSIPKAQNGQYYKVVCTQQLEQGNRSVMPAYQRLVREYNPSLIILLGIGGSISPEVGICDVVFADQIFYYDERSVTPEGTNHRGEGYRIPALLKPFINDFLVGLVADKLPSNSLLEPDFKLHFGPLGTGEAVIKYREAEERKYLLTINDKTLVLETEAGGFAQAFYEDELSKVEKANATLIVRGISDHADVKKNDDWRKIASENAVTAVVELLKSISEFAPENLFSQLVNEVD